MYASVQASANIWSIFECRSNSVCTINKLNPLFGSDDIVRCLCIIFFRCFHLIFRIVVIFIAPHCQNTQSIDLSHGDWHVHACMKNKQRERVPRFMCVVIAEKMDFFAMLFSLLSTAQIYSCLKKQACIHDLQREKEKKSSLQNN